eukprot:Nk52_evm17s1967 gene=Nk52_evmTU17s1967
MVKDSIISSESVGCEIDQVRIRQKNIVDRCKHLQKLVAKIYESSPGQSLAGPVLVNNFKTKESCTIPLKKEGEIPKDVIRVRDAYKASGEHGLCCLQQVEGDYYEWGLERRAAVLGAPSVNHLCKTIIMENTKFDEADPVFNGASRYYMIVIQYTARLRTPNLEAYVCSQCENIPSKKIGFQMCNEEKAFEMTGFGKNAICPIGSIEQLPIIVDKRISELSPPIFWMGGGDVDWKLLVEFQDFMKRTGASCVAVS